MAFFGPTATDICVVRGDSPVIPITISDNTGSAIDITGGVFTMTVDPNEEPSGSGGNLFSIPGTIISPTAGTVSFQPNTAQTGIVGEYFYDVQMELNGSVRTILKGGFDIEQDITKT